MKLSVLEQSSLSEVSSAAEAISMQKRKLDNLEVSAIGLGCISMSFGYGPAGDRQEKKCHFATSWSRTMVP